MVCGQRWLCGRPSSSSEFEPPRPAAPFSTSSHVMRSCVVDEPSLDIKTTVTMQSTMQSGRLGRRQQGMAAGGCTSPPASASVADLSSVACCVMEAMKQQRHRSSWAELLPEVTQLIAGLLEDDDRCAGCGLGSGAGTAGPTGPPPARQDWAAAAAAHPHRDVPA